MNINAYDLVEPCYKDKVYVNPTYKTLNIPNIKFRKYYILLQRYNTLLNQTLYYLYLSDEVIPNSRIYSTAKLNDGTIRIKLNSIWNKTTLKDMVTDTPVFLDFKEGDDNGEIYFIDV